MDVNGKKAIIFGGTSGIGLAAAKKLAALGATVVAVSRNPDRAGPVPVGISMVACDVLDRDGVAKVLEAHAPFDILVAAATGGVRARGTFLEMGLEGFQASFAKLWGYSNVLQLGTPHLSENGCIVLVSGTPARRPNPGQVALSAVGGAVEALARAVAREIAPRRLNVVAPGTIDTPMVALEGAERAAHYTKATAGNLIPRAGTADEVADGILFVITNDFVTGTTVDIDGGRLLA